MAKLEAELEASRSKMSAMEESADVQSSELAAEAKAGVQRMEAQLAAEQARLKEMEATQQKALAMNASLVNGMTEMDSAAKAQLQHMQMQMQGQLSGVRSDALGAAAAAAAEAEQ
eukprot:SAG11_NODE_26680_length_342_cov_0.839506_1_plen_114_part_11